MHSFAGSNAGERSYGIDPFEPISPDTVPRNIAIDLKALRMNINTLEENLAVFVDIKPVKLWLKHCKIAPVEPEFEFMSF
ncbi:hypothetical protein WS67_11565 [Burkholderia singularis]|uniref:Uncharacterized protein n=1 Tax=Burkholderia singularis TaxID=1503053 RepID=A0A103E3J3_9BURK|nr:hypothetical protein WS67_11565 [Burkholderia singularis]